MCGGGFLGSLLGGLGSILGLSSTNKTETPKIQTKPTEINSGKAELDAKQNEKKRAALRNGMNANILGGSAVEASTGKKSLLGE